MPRFLSLVTALLLLIAAPALAECTGQDLMADLPAEQRAALDAAVAAQPFAQGNLWQATRGDSIITVVGTYHMADPRHAAMLDRLHPILAQAKTLLVEAAPDEEARLKAAMTKDASLILITEGPSLLEQMDKAEWQKLAAALEQRGIPAFMAARFKPWYVSALLAMPPCAAAGATPDGLDKMLVAAAEQAGLPVRSLEPYDTVFKLFSAMSAKEQLDLIRSTLLFEDIAAPQDVSATLANLYFAEDSRRMWEFMRLSSRKMPGYTAAEVDDEFARMEDVLMSRRNQTWIAVLEDAAAKGPVVAGFGALHLAGQNGVLNLLQDRGFTLTRLTR